MIHNGAEPSQMAELSLEPIIPKCRLWCIGFYICTLGLTNIPRFLFFELIEMEMLPVYLSKKRNDGGFKD